MKKYVGTIALATALLMSAPAAFALTADVGGTGYTNSSTGVSVGSGTSVNANTNVNATVSGSADTGSQTSGSASDNGSSNAGTENNTSASGDMSGNANADINVGDVISITRADVSGDADATATGAGAVTAESVTNNDNLSAFAKTTMKSDADVNAVEMSDNAVSLGYKARAKLFGFIPVFINAKARVEAGGSTSISYPWYAFLASKDDASLRADIQAATATSVHGSGSANASAKLSSSEKARILQEMHAAMKSNLQATLAAEGSANGSTSTQ